MAPTAPASHLKAPAATHPGGRPSTFPPEKRQELLKVLRLGAHVSTGCAMVGISEGVFKAWAKRGAKELERRDAYGMALEVEEVNDSARSMRVPKDERERRALRDAAHMLALAGEAEAAEFSLALAAALAAAEVGNVATIATSAKGGHVLERRTVTDANGAITVYEKKSKPEWQAAAWWLERRNPERWARRLVVEDTGDAGPDGAADVVSDLAALLDAMAQRRAAAKARTPEGTFIAPK